MIRIRYSDLPAGLHARAEVLGRSTVIYLLPGLSGADRRAALQRLRRSGALGYGPRLPASGVAVAIVLDRVLTLSRHCAGAFRAHPYLLLPPTIIVVTAGLATVLAATTTIAIRTPGGGAPGPGSSSSLGVVAPPSAAPGRPGHSRGAGHRVDPHPGQGTTRPARPSRSGHPASSPAQPSSTSPSSSGTVPAPPSPSSSVAPEPSGSGSPAPSPSPTASGACLDVGPLGICLPG